MSNVEVVTANMAAVARVIAKHQKGRIFTIYTKSKMDGRDLMCNGRMNVTKYLKGGVNHSANKPDLLTGFYDVKRKHYISVNLNAITKIKANGLTITIA